MLQRAIPLAIFLGSLSVQLSSNAAPNARPFVYCVPTEDVDLDPFKPLGAPTRLLYLRLITRSFVSTDASEPGLFSRWQFDSKGRVLTADIAKDAVWKNGRRLTPREAGHSLAKALRSKPLGQRVHVLGSEALDAPDWTTKSIPGVRVLSEERLEIEFEGVIDNLSGAVREALSTNSRPNRLWPVRFDEDGGQKVIPDVLSKFPIADLQRNSVALDVLEHRVVVQAGCERGDFFSYMPPLDEENLFSSQAQKSSQALYAVVNPEAQGLKTSSERQSLLNWIRASLSERHAPGFSLSQRHFLKGEPGFDAHGHSREPAVAAGWKPPRKLVVGLGTPWPERFPVRVALEAAARKEAVSVEWVPFYDRAPKEIFHLRLAGTNVKQGRSLWIQDIMDFKPLAEVWRKFPATQSALLKSRDRSAATVPVENATLLAIETATREEVSVVPVGRYRNSLFSRKSLPIELVFTPENEITFKRRSQK